MQLVSLDIALMLALTNKLSEISHVHRWYCHVAK